MRKITWQDRIGHAFDRVMSRSPVAMIRRAYAGDVVAPAADR